MYILTYDISNDRRRTKLYKRLLDLGVPVQFSVFELPEANLDRARSACAEITNDDDSIRVYHLCKRCARTTILIGSGKPLLNDSASRVDVIEVPELPSPEQIEKMRKGKERFIRQGELEMGTLNATSHLMEMICGIDNLNEAFLEVKANRGCAGSDGVSIAAFDGKRFEHLNRLQKTILERTYRPQPLRVFTIPKSDGSARVLRVPAVRDRVAQQAVLRIISPVWEKEFEDTSFAYRKGRSVRQAINLIGRYRRDGYIWVLRADIDDYFDEIPHEALAARFKEHIRDEQLISLVTLWITNISTIHGPECAKGIPQGSAVSPLLSNVYLDRFDEAIDSLGYKMVRYADDFVILCRSEQDVHLALQDAKRELEKDCLRLHSGKTFITNFQRGFTFLGYLLIGSFAIKKSKIPAGWNVSASGENK